MGAALGEETAAGGGASGRGLRGGFTPPGAPCWAEAVGGRRVLPGLMSGGELAERGLSGPERLHHTWEARSDGARSPDAGASGSPLPSPSPGMETLPVS